MREPAASNGSIIVTEQPAIHQEIEQHTAVRPHVVHAAVVRNGERELSRSNSALAWSGLAAGFSMALSFIGEGVLRAHLPDQPWSSLVVHFGYTFGFLVVILARQQLFTENTLTGFLPLLNDLSWRNVRRVTRLWLVVLTANLTGAHLGAWVLSNTNAFPPEVKAAFDQLARQAADVSFGTALLRGVFAGWIIALLVWILAALESHSVGVIVLLSYLIAIGGFTHIVAGSIEVLYLVMAGSLSWPQFVGGYMLPTLIGNVLGGISLVSALNHAQVASDEIQEENTATDS